MCLLETTGVLATGSTVKYSPLSLSLCVLGCVCIRYLKPFSFVYLLICTVINWPGRLISPAHYNIQFDSNEIDVWTNPLIIRCVEQLSLKAIYPNASRLADRDNWPMMLIYQTVLVIIDQIIVVHVNCVTSLTQDDESWQDLKMNIVTALSHCTVFVINDSVRQRED